MGEEIWKIKYGFTKYEISNFGGIRIISNKNIVKCKPNNNGYYLCYLYSDEHNYDKPIYPHLVVAELFINNPNDLPRTKHINGNKSNNRFTNLMWVRSNGENYKTKIIYTLNDIDGEIWSKIPGFPTIYEVSNFGRVRNLNYGRTNKMCLMTQRLDRYGYYKVSIKNKLKSVHQLVAMAFLNHTPDGTMNLVINHKDSDRTNNRVDNLEIVTHRQNIYHGANNRKSSSKYVGVSLCTGYKNKWICGIRFNNKTYNLGIFKSEEEAGETYEKAKYALENNRFNEFCFNYIKPGSDFSSKYKGVFFKEEMNKYVSSITRNKNTYRLDSIMNMMLTWNLKRPRKHIIMVCLKNIWKA